MEPIHITEFASERYYQKLDQEAKQRAAASAPGESSTTTIQQQHQHQTIQAPFILPLRGSTQLEPVDETAKTPADHKQKNRFLNSFRFKSHSKAPIPSTTPAEPWVQQPQQYQWQQQLVDRRVSIAESTKTRYVCRLEHLG